METELFFVATNCYVVGLPKELWRHGYIYDNIHYWIESGLYVLEAGLQSFEVTEASDFFLKKINSIVK